MSLVTRPCSTAEAKTCSCGHGPEAHTTELLCDECEMACLRRDKASPTECGKAFTCAAYPEHIGPCVSDLVWYETREACDAVLARERAARELIDAIHCPPGRDFDAAWDRATMLFGRFGAKPTLLCPETASTDVAVVKSLAREEAFVDAASIVRSWKNVENEEGKRLVEMIAQKFDWAIGEVRRCRERATHGEEAKTEGANDRGADGAREEVGAARGGAGQDAAQSVPPAASRNPERVVGESRNASPTDAVAAFEEVKKLLAGLTDDPDARCTIAEADMLDHAVKLAGRRGQLGSVVGVVSHIKAGMRRETIDACAKWLGTFAIGEWGPDPRFKVSSAVLQEIAEAMRKALAADDAGQAYGPPLAPDHPKAKRGVK